MARHPQRGLAMGHVPYPSLASAPPSWHQLDPQPVPTWAVVACTMALRRPAACEHGPRKLGPPVSAAQHGSSAWPHFCRHRLQPGPILAHQQLGLASACSVHHLFPCGPFPPVAWVRCLGSSQHCSCPCHQGPVAPQLVPMWAIAAYSLGLPGPASARSLGTHLLACVISSVG